MIATDDVVDATARRRVLSLGAISRCGRTGWATTGPGCTTGRRAGTHTPHPTLTFFNADEDSGLLFLLDRGYLPHLGTLGTVLHTCFGGYWCEGHGKSGDNEHTADMAGRCESHSLIIANIFKKRYELLANVSVNETLSALDFLYFVSTTKNASAVRPSGRPPACAIISPQPRIRAGKPAGSVC